MQNWNPASTLYIVAIILVIFGIPGDQSSAIFSSKVIILTSMDIMLTQLYNIWVWQFCHLQIALSSEPPAHTLFIRSESVLLFFLLSQMEEWGSHPAVFSYLWIVVSKLYNLNSNMETVHSTNVAIPQLSSCSNTLLQGRVLSMTIGFWIYLPIK